MKYIRPLYKELVKAGELDLANEIFNKNKLFYHSIAAKMVSKDLEVKKWKIIIISFFNKFYWEKKKNNI